LTVVGALKKARAKVLSKKSWQSVKDKSCWLGSRIPIRQHQSIRCGHRPHKFSTWQVPERMHSALGLQADTHYTPLDKVTGLHSEHALTLQATASHDAKPTGIYEKCNMLEFRHQ